MLIPVALSFIVAFCSALVNADFDRSKVSAIVTFESMGARSSVPIPLDFSQVYALVGPVPGTPISFMSVDDVGQEKGTEIQNPYGIWANIECVFEDDHQVDVSFTAQNPYIGPARSLLWVACLIKGDPQIA